MDRPAAPDEPVVEALGLAKRFGVVPALDGLDMRVDAGRIHGIVGPNGAGKTTFLRILFGLVAPDAGTVSVFGRPWDAATPPDVGGFVEEPRFYPYLSARRNLELLADLDGVSRDPVDDLLDLVGLLDRAGRKVGGFSSGMRQRLGLASSLLRSPSLLLLDEPTVGLDPSGARDVLGLVRGLAAEGRTVLLSSHNMTELDGVCDAVTVLREGRAVWAGSMERLRREAPAPAHRLWTSDDARAVDAAREHPGVRAAPDPEGWLTVNADRDALDAYMVALGPAGIAVRRLELLMTPLESMFFELTGERAADSIAPSELGVAT